jgi:hypothetical protein
MWVEVVVCVGAGWCGWWTLAAKSVVHCMQIVGAGEERKGGERHCKASLVK